MRRSRSPACVRRTTRGSTGNRPPNRTAVASKAMAITPDGKYLYAALEGANIADPDQNRRYVYEFSIAHKALTGRTWQYHTAEPGTHGRRHGSARPAPTRRSSNVTAAEV